MGQATGSGGPVQGGVNAPAAVRHLVEEYRRFLRTTYRFLHPKLRSQFKVHLSSADVVVRGPYVTLARDFALGPTLPSLVDAGDVDASLLLILAYRFETDCLVVTLPARAAGRRVGKWTFSSTLVTMAEALLAGAGSVLELEPRELQAFVRRRGDESADDQIVIYETAPGGAGYVSEAHAGGASGG